MTTLPDSLDVQGDLPDAPLAVAIVGARAAFAADAELAHELARAVAARGGVVVSGGAIGIDAAAHRGALAAGGRTIAVLGTGIDIVYPPRNAGLFAEIPRSGALVSGYPRGTPPLGRHFVARNAVIAALSDHVVVVGAAARSGALHTAAIAVRLGRGLAAAPGAAGSDALLADGAALVASPDDLAAYLDGTPRRPTAVAPAAGSEADRVLAALSAREPRDLEDLALRTGLPLRVAQRALSDLELRGLVVLAPGQAYLRSSLVAVTA